MRRFRVSDLVAGFLLGFAFLLVIFLFSSDIAAHYEVCETTKEGAKECARYGVVGFAFREIGAALNDYNGLITAAATVFIAWFTLTLRRSTDKLWDAGNEQRLSAEAIAKRQSDEMQKSIAVANRAATVAERALVATDRAWIAISAEITENLVFGKDQISIGIAFNLTNVGKSPATHLEIQSRFCRDLIEARKWGDDAADWSRYSLLDFGVVLFPNETLERDGRGMQISSESFRQNIAEAKARAQDEKDLETDWSTAQPAIMVCARYRLAGSNKSHHTIILFEISHANPSHLGWDGSEGETSLVNLKLVQTILSGQAT
jgi:hypothetical protein